MRDGYQFGEKDVLTTGEVARICNVASRTVSKWFDSGALQGYRIPGSKDRRIPVSNLLQFMKKHNIPMDGLISGAPRVLIVDEPTAALDTALGRQVVQLLRREIKDRGKTGIMVTHDLRMVEYTDRVFEILDGHLTHVEEPSALQH